jgi:histidyl-tRNA synthetase
MEIITAVKGFKDVLPGESEKWQFVEGLAREIFAHFEVKELRVPIIEKTALFKRGIGETTDIVEKEMYAFIDRDGDQISPRPEATASVLRAYIEHSLHQSEPSSKFYTIGPMFRRERPQKGRLRQFHQINVEYIGYSDSYIDAEVMLMLMHMLKSMGVPELRLQINSLGCPKCRGAFREEISKFLSERKAGLCGDCLRRMETNPLRVFDCKVEGCKEVLAGAPTILDFLDEDCRLHFKMVQEYLEVFEIEFEINPRMVRGLDYYVRTAFEVTSESLGSQNAVAGGGRYDGLISQLGGPDLPAIGFAIGMERLISLIPAPNDEFIKPVQLFIVPLGETGKVWAFALCNYLRMLGIKADMGEADKSLKSQMKRANKIKSEYALIIGEQEINEGKAQLKNMSTGSQEALDLEDFDRLAEEIISKVSGR